MSGIVRVRVFLHGSGLCNELMILINNIIIARIHGAKAVILHGFSNTYDAAVASSIGDTIDLDHLNRLIAARYPDQKIKIYGDRQDVVQIVKATYGNLLVEQDVTEKFKAVATVAGGFEIKRTYDFNHLFGDPWRGQQKWLSLTYTINDDLYTEALPEVRHEDVVCHPAHIPGHYGMVHNKTHLAEQESILRDIRFVARYHDHVAEQMKVLPRSKRLNVVHIRIERDAVAYWSGRNGMTTEAFTKQWISNYQIAIRNYFSLEDDVIALCGEDNAVTEHMRKCGYHVITLDKTGFPCPAAIDLLAADYCNNVFIGAFNPHNLAGSTFSQTISLRLGNRVTKVLFDIDHVLGEPYVIVGTPK